MRALVLETFYEWSKVPYQKWMKKEQPWNITIKELLKYPKESLGFHLGSFLLQHNFTPQPKLENHDVFHVLTQTGITVPEEIAMQYYLLGNRKKSLYLILVILVGTVLYPDKYKVFLNSYTKGKRAFSFHHLDFKKLLPQSIATIRTTFLIQTL